MRLHSEIKYVLTITMDILAELETILREIKFWLVYYDFIRTQQQS